MKRYVLLFDGACAACSQLARLVQDLAVTDLEPGSLDRRHTHNARPAMLHSAHEQPVPAARGES